MHERALLLALIEFLPNIEPSVTRVADMLGADESTVRRLVKSCVSKGLLHVEQRPGRRSRYELADLGQFATPGVLRPRAECPDTPGKSPGPPRANRPTKQLSKDVKEAERGAQRARGWRRVPSTWEPTEDHRKLAAELGVDFGTELASFRDYDFASPKRDPDATFRNWLRKARPGGGSRRAAPQGSEPDEVQRVLGMRGLA